MNDNKPVLLVEDDKVDALIVKRAFQDLNIHNAIIYADNGEEALNYLINDKNDKPCLILLDINMPKMNGIEFLKELRKDESITNIPVVVMTTSRNEGDRKEMFELSVSGYMIKSFNYNDFLKTIDIIKSYWTLSKFPPYYQ
jgi:CheY-like chemotaxis protein